MTFRTRYWKSQAVLIIVALLVLGAVYGWRWMGW